jgi:hypothetical protein
VHTKRNAMLEIALILVAVKARILECPVCGPVLGLLGEQPATGLGQSSIDPIAVNLLGDVPKSSNSDRARRANFSFPSGRRTAIHGTTQIEQPPRKRAKTEPTSPNCAQLRSHV